MPPKPPQRLLDMRDRRLRQDAVAEIEDQRALGEVLQDVVDRAVERGAAGEQHQRVEIALHGDAALHVRAHERRLRGPVDADRVDRHLRRDSASSEAPAPRGKPMIFAPGTARRTFSTMRRTGATHQRSNSAVGSTPAQVSKICTASAPALSCSTR